MDDTHLKRLDEFLNRIIMFQADIQEFRREFLHLLETHRGKADELQVLESTAKARRGEIEQMQNWVSDLVDKLNAKKE